MTRSPHHVIQHRSALAGAEARTLISVRAFPRHAHDQFGIGWVFRGGHRSWSGVGQVESGPGDVIASNPGEVHDGFACGGAARGWRMLYLEPALVEAAIADDLDTGLEALEPSVRDPVLSGLVRRLFARTVSPACAPLALETDLLRTLARAMRPRGAVRRAPRFSPSVARALDRLDAAPQTAPTLAELSALAGVSRFQLLRGFAREVGVTPHAYLVQRRVQQARRRLARGQAPAAVAQAAGFADQSHMTRAFVRQFGVTPGRYQRAFS